MFVCACGFGHFYVKMAKDFRAVCFEYLVTSGSALAVVDLQGSYAANRRTVYSFCFPCVLQESAVMKGSPIWRKYLTPQRPRPSNTSLRVSRGSVALHTPAAQRLLHTSHKAVFYPSLWRML